VNWLKAIGERYRASADPIRAERRVELVVVVLALFLLLQLVHGFSRLAIISTPEAVAPTADSLRVIASLGQDTVAPEQNDEIRSRPLLWPGRRPATPTTVDAAAPARAKQQELNEIKLLGVFGAGETIGIIARVKDRTQRIRLGEEVAGWKLKSVEESGAVFAAGSRQKTIMLLPEPTDKAVKIKKRREMGGT
jgi:hypothetical protein